MSIDPVEAKSRIRVNWQRWAKNPCALRRAFQLFALAASNGSKRFAHRRYPSSPSLLSSSRFHRRQTVPRAPNIINLWRILQPSRSVQFLTASWYKLNIDFLVLWACFARSNFTRFEPVRWNFLRLIYDFAHKLTQTKSSYFNILRIFTYKEGKIIEY